MNRRATRWLLRTVPLLLLTVSIGCQSGPTVAEVQEETDRQHRVLQQTISQLRKGLDEVRSQRDDVQTKFVRSSDELASAEKKLEFLEAQVRAESTLAKSRGGALETHKDQLARTKRELSEVKERATRLEREMTTLRVAFEAEQMAHKKLQQTEASFAGKVTAVEDKFARAQLSWDAERTALRESLQASEDEIAVLEERIADGEGGTAVAGVTGDKRPVDRTPKTNSTNLAANSGSRGSTTNDPLPRGRSDYYDTPPPLPTGPTTTNGGTGATAASNVGGSSGETVASGTSTNPATRGSTPEVASVSKPGSDGAEVAVANEEPVSFIEQAKQSINFGIIQVRSFINNPSKNYRDLLHPVPIAMILIVLGIPLLMFRTLRRRRKKAKQSRETVRVSVDSTRAAKRPVRSATAARRPTARVDENSTVSGQFQPSDEPMSPANVGSIAATLDAVLGGDPVEPGGSVAKKKPAASDPVVAEGGTGDEDDLLGDLKDIVSKGLS